MKREEFEIQSMPDKDQMEKEDIYKAKGSQGKELGKIVNGIASDKHVWVEVMTTEELGLNLEII